MNFELLQNIELNLKTVLVRVDINVPFYDGKISDASRIKRIKPTIQKILNSGAKPVLIAHFGRPNGKYEAKLSLRNTLEALQKELGVKVNFCDQTVGEKPKNAIKKLEKNTVLLLENVRFLNGEEKNWPSLGAKMSELADIYCNDSFSVSHRAHASTSSITHYLPSVAGLLLQEELGTLENLIRQPKSPISGLVGGAKISTKLELLKNLTKNLDHLVIGGGMANTFLLAQGKNVGKSLCEPEMIDTAKVILADAQKQNCEIHLPLDIVCAKQFKSNSPFAVYSSDSCPSHSMILDVGSKTINHIQTIFQKSKTLLWNGPLGAFEVEPFDNGTNTVARLTADLTQSKSLISVAGGGDTVSALNKANVTQDFSYVSTAGGAFLEWIEGKELPGLVALEKAFKVDKP